MSHYVINKYFISLSLGSWRYLNTEQELLSVFTKKISSFTSHKPPSNVASFSIGSCNFVTLLKVGEMYSKKVTAYSKHNAKLKPKINLMDM